MKSKQGNIDVATLTRDTKTIIDPIVRRGAFLEPLSDLPLIREVSCDGCGACCMHMGYPPFIGMYDYDGRNGDVLWLGLPRELAMEARQGAIDRRGEQELPCIWLDPETRKCKHYESRPTVCRDFEMGSEDCITHRERSGIQ